MIDVLNDKMLLQYVITITTDAIMVLDRNWVTVYMNEPACEITRPLGHSPVGRDVWSCFPEANYPGSPYVEHSYRAMDEGIPGEIERTTHPSSSGSTSRDGRLPQASSCLRETRRYKSE